MGPPVVSLNHLRFNLGACSWKAALEKMSRKPNESMGDYAFRWRQVAIGQKVSLEDDEVMKIFLKTLGTTYQVMLLTQMHLDFKTIVKVVIRIKKAIKEGLIEDIDGKSNITPEPISFKPQPILDSPMHSIQSPSQQNFVPPLIPPIWKNALLI